MGTIFTTTHELAGALGPILVDVRATSRGASQPAVLLHHGFKGWKDYAFFPPFADRLARAGFTAVTLSLSGSGVGPEGEFSWADRFARNTYSMELDDLHVVVRALMAGALGVPEPTALGVMGHSRGGGTALCLAREIATVRAVVTWAAISRVRRHTDVEIEAWRRAGRIMIPNQRTGVALPLSYDIVVDALEHEHGRFDIAAAATTLRRPWLLVHGTADETVPIDEGRWLAALATDPPAETLFVPGANHSFGSRHPWAGPSADLERIFDVSTRFLTRHLG